MMLRRHFRSVAIILGSLLLLGQVVPSDTPGQWSDQLESLTPAQPMAYFELAEEMADAGDDAQARSLFGLAGALAPDELGRSACLALANLAESQDRRRLLALADLLGDGRASSLSTPVDPVAASPLGARLGVGAAFGYWRAGRGTAAIAAIEDRPTEQLLQALDDVIPGGVNRLREDSQNYRKNLPPSLSRGEIDRLLRIEIGLLALEEQPWSTARLLSGDAPLVEVDPDDLGTELGVDTTRPWYRDGRWVSEPADDVTS